MHDLDSQVRLAKVTLISVAKLDYAEAQDVNLERVVRIEPYGKDSRLAILTDGTRLPVSRAGYARLKALLDERPSG